MIRHLTPTSSLPMLILLPLVAPLALSVSVAPRLIPAAVPRLIQDDPAEKPAESTEVVLGPEGHRYRCRSSLLEVTQQQQNKISSEGATSGQGSGAGVA